MDIRKVKSYSVGAACIIDKLTQKGVDVECEDQMFNIIFHIPGLAEVETQNGDIAKVTRTDNYTKYKCSCLIENCNHIQAVRKFMGFNI